MLNDDSRVSNIGSGTTQVRLVPPCGSAEESVRNSSSVVTIEVCMFVVVAVCLFVCWFDVLGMHGCGWGWQREKEREGERRQQHRSYIPPLGSQPLPLPSPDERSYSARRAALLLAAIGSRLNPMLVSTQPFLHYVTRIQSRRLSPLASRTQSPPGRYTLRSASGRSLAFSTPRWSLVRPRRGRHLGCSAL